MYTCSILCCVYKVRKDISENLHFVIFGPFLIQIKFMVYGVIILLSVIKVVTAIYVYVYLNLPVHPGPNFNQQMLISVIASSHL